MFDTLTEIVEKIQVKFPYHVIKLALGTDRHYLMIDGRKTVICIPNELIEDLLAYPVPPLNEVVMQYAECVEENIEFFSLRS